MICISKGCCNSCCPCSSSSSEQGEVHPWPCRWYKQTIKHDKNINILKSKFNWAKKKIDDPWHKFYYTNSGDKAQPYKHDTAGDVAEPYKHDPKANYVHDPSGESDNIIIYSLAPNTAPGDTAKPYEKDSNGWWSLMKEENLNNLLSSAAFVSNCYNQK